MENTILIVDDNHETVDALSSLFLQHSWLPVRAYSGEEALSYLSRMLPLVVVCDLAMPGMSGYDVAEATRSQYPENCPLLIALTGWSDRGVAEQAINAGFHLVLTKPIAFDDLISAVNLASLARCGLGNTPATGALHDVPP